MAETKLTHMMMNRDKLMLRRKRTPWYKFKERKRLALIIQDYKKDIDEEMEREMLANPQKYSGTTKYKKQ